MLGQGIHDLQSQLSLTVVVVGGKATSVVLDDQSVQVAFHRLHQDIHVTTCGIGERMLVGVRHQFAEDDAELDRRVLVGLDATGLQLVAHGSAVGEVHHRQ